MKKYLVGILLTMFAVSAMAAPELRALPWQTAVRVGASHCIEFSYKDLTSTATNTAVEYTNTVTAPASVEFVGMVLDPAFDSTSVTNALSMTMSCGVSGATTKWLSAKQVCSDGTEIKTSFGTTYSGTATVALTLTTNLVASTVIATNGVEGVATSTVYFVSGATGASTVTIASPLVQEQTSDIAIVTTFNALGGTLYSHSQLGSGKVRLFFRVFTPNLE
jgi:hypothetical protein